MNLTTIEPKTDVKPVPMTSYAVETLKFVRQFCGKTIMIKLGGSTLENMSLVKNLCKDLALVRAAGVSLIIVHGGGPSINRELELRGIKWEFHNGLRITTPEMMQVIEMVLCGKVNRFIQ